MPSAAKNDVPVAVDVGGYEGRSAEWGDFTVTFETAEPGEPRELFKGLPDDKCQCPHWGYLLKGKITIDYGDREETITAGQAYYLPPGHVPRIDEPTESVEFSPTAELRKTMDHVQAKLAAMGDA